MSHKRTTWEETHLARLNVLSGRATCERGRSAALFADPETQADVAQGYVGSPPGMPHCDDVGHEWEYRVTKFKHTGQGSEVVDYSKHCVRTIHAEMNAILSAARLVLKGKVLYTKMVPCWNCAKHLSRLNLSGIVAEHQYQQSDRTLELFDAYGIPVKVINKEYLYDSKTTDTRTDNPECEEECVG